MPLYPHLLYTIRLDINKQLNRRAAARIPDTTKFIVNIDRSHSLGVEIHLLYRCLANSEWGLRILAFDQANQRIDV